MKKHYQSIVVLALLALFAEVASAQPTPGFNNKIPKSLLTPDTVNTRVGTLKFFDGIPTEETAGLLLDNLDVNRGIDTFLNGMPASNVEAARRGHVELGQKEAHQKRDTNRNTAGGQQVQARALERGSLRSEIGLRTQDQLAEIADAFHHGAFRLIARAVRGRGAR